jgi:hypothetical protein
LQWEPAEVTTFEYDDDGRLIRSVTVREAEFSPEDVALLIASRRSERVKRSPTGYTIAEATDPENADAFYVRRNEKGVPLPKRDYSMIPLLRAQDDYYKQFPDAKGDSSYVWTVEKRTQE